MVSKQPEKVAGDEEDQASAAEEMPTCFDTSEFGKFLEVSFDRVIQLTEVKHKALASSL